MFIILQVFKNLNLPNIYYLCDADVCLNQRMVLFYYLLINILIFLSFIYIILLVILPYIPENTDKIIVPILNIEAHHWILGVVDLIHNSILIFNSMRSSQCLTSKQALRNILLSYYNREFNLIDQDCLQQVDSSSCGFYLVLFIYCHIFNFDIPSSINPRNLRNAVIKIIETSNLDSFNLDTLFDFNQVIFKILTCFG